MRISTPEKLPNLRALTRDRLAKLGGVAVAAAIFLAACGPDSENAISTATPPPPTGISVAEGNLSPERERYPKHTVIATIFWIGEESSADNANITNEVTAWDSNPVDRFGGVDDPNNRTDEGLPQGLELEHTPYYVALPAAEFTEDGLVPGAREASPWSGEKVGQNESLFKGRWVKITREGVDDPVYAQWLDTGPSDDVEVKDYEYVFGGSDAKPKNTFGLKAGIDVSPAVAHALGISMEEGGAVVTWQFVDAEDVPDGPWKDYPPIDNKTYWK